MFPRCSIAASRFTITLPWAIRCAPRLSVTVMIIGRNSGVSPTASARAKSSDSSGSRRSRAPLLRRDPLESLLFALALAVGLTPEFLPMIMTVTLSRGAQRMAQGKVIVKRLAAIEHLGNMDVLCSDKTGTLTRGVVTLGQHVDASGIESEDVLRWACVNSALESGIRSPLDVAILAHDHPAVADYAKRME